VGDPRVRRLAANENLARRINEVAECEEPRSAGSRAHFMCECCKADCVETVSIDPGSYARVRSHLRRFIVRKGHDNPEIESVVERYPGYDVVEKRGEAGRLAEADAMHA
jgi:hypothetical protein